MSKLIIADNTIGINKDGLYCLNDMHKAAMALGKATVSQRPGEFTRYNEEFIRYSENAGMPALKQTKGRNGGTWASELVAMKYAGWMNPVYEVQVYQAVQALKRGDIEAAVNLSDSKAARKSLDDMRHAKAIELNLANVEKFRKLFPNLGEKANQTFAAALLNPVLGMDAIQLPKIEEKFYTTTELAEEFESTPAMLGRLANQNNLKINTFGEYRLSKSQYSSKQVEQFYWNTQGKEAIRDILVRLRT